MCDPKARNYLKIPKKNTHESVVLINGEYLQISIFNLSAQKIWAMKSKTFWKLLWNYKMEHYSYSLFRNWQY